MELRFTINTKIQKNLSEVFDAVYNPKKLQGYFTTKFASAPLDEGTTVYWEFADFPTEDGKGFPVIVKQMVKNEKIVFEWEANDGDHSSLTAQKYNTVVEMGFEALDDNSTKVTITESGWKETPTGLKGSYGNCQGWAHMSACLKAYVEYGINLRKGMY